MSISRDQITATARLARIRLEQSEIDEVTSRIASILDMVDQMQAVDTGSVEPMASALDAVQMLRRDEVSEPDGQDAKVAARDTLMRGAPAVEDGLFLVPRVIE